jgi:hypothetical protein
MRDFSRYTQLLCVLVLCGTTVAQVREQERRNDRPAPNSAAPGGTKDHAAAQIDKFARLVSGTWDVEGFSAPGAPVKEDTGRTVLKFGPGNLSLIEDFHSEGSGGKVDALGLFWWDEKAGGYRTMFCANAEPDGCILYNGTGRWEGDAVVFRFILQVNGAADYVKEVISRSNPDSFTAVFSHGKSEALLKPTYTWRHTRVAQ